MGGNEVQLKELPAAAVHFFADSTWCGCATQTHVDSNNGLKVAVDLGRA